MNAMIAVIFIALAVATVNAGVIGGVSPLIASPLSAASVITGPSVVASPLSAGIVGVPAPLAVSRSVIATPHASIVSAPAISPLSVAPLAVW